MRITNIRTIAVEVKLPKPVYDANYTMATKPRFLSKSKRIRPCRWRAAHFGGRWLRPRRSSSMNYATIDRQDPRDIDILE